MIDVLSDLMAERAPRLVSRTAGGSRAIRPKDPAPILSGAGPGSIQFKADLIGPLTRCAALVGDAQS